MSDLPGVPLPSGFTPLPEDEQERMRKEHRALQRRIAPFIEDVQRARRHAMSHAHNYVVGTAVSGEQVTCPDCTGSGHAHDWTERVPLDFRPCSRCEGTGSIPKACGWPLPHRDKHRCACVCVLNRGHKGHHKCGGSIQKENSDG